MVAFCRIDDKEIRLREPIMEPDALIIQDPTLLHQVDVFSGLQAGDGYMLINTTRSFDELGTRRVRARASGPSGCCTVPATELALKHLGRPLPNAVLLGGFAAVIGHDLARLGRGGDPASKFSGKVPQATSPPPTAAYDFVRQEMEEASSRCSSRLKARTAVAEAVALCRPEVICAYPISPQTHIVEALGEMVKSGALAPCEFINVEMRVRGDERRDRRLGRRRARLHRHRQPGAAVHGRGGVQRLRPGLPIVMTVANRAIGAPINIWNDHSDSMSQRDCGWIQLFAENNQEALDLHIQAFKLGEELSLPVMVCMDGFILTHAYERRGHARRRRRSTPTCRRTSRARCSTRPSRCRSARWSGRRPSWRCATWRTPSR